jgi:acyl-CoA synthetase (AMP-forming)/AMP-acid ligase II
MTSYNLSELFEQVVARVPNAEALVTSDKRLTYSQLNERANRLANALRDLGIGESDKVGLHLQNGSEYLEGMLAAFKLRAIPVNINYRYVERELEHLYSLTDLKALVVHRQYAPLVAAIRPNVATLQSVIVVDDGSGVEPGEDTLFYEPVLEAASASNDFPGRSGDDLYISCTGGTTGMPKGVVWRQEDIFFATMGGGDPTTLLGPISLPEELTERVLDPGIAAIVTPPLMHVSAHWGAFQMMFGGGKVVLPPVGSFSAATVWKLVEEEQANLITLVGDAMVRPMLDAYAQAAKDGTPFDGSSLLVLASGGALVSGATKTLAKELLPNVVVVDGFGSTETGVTGMSTGAGPAGRAGTGFTMDERMAVLDDNLEPVEPGSEVVGRLARRGRIPIGYYKDPEKTAATFVEKDGVRWVLPGDLASVEADGEVILHGRGSTSINTGGEKVFPEEVESALIEHAAIADILVVGMPDERWGNRVVAVAALREDQQLCLDEVKTFARNRLAGYKVPRELVIVDSIQRNPNGKADYGWAREQAEAAGAAAHEAAHESAGVSA